MFSEVALGLGFSHSSTIYDFHNSDVDTSLFTRALYTGESDMGQRGENSRFSSIPSDGGESINIVLLNRLCNKNSVKSSKFVWGSLPGSPG
jgi:hypothetical protein